ncbi:MAG: alanine dehydrogenase [Oscillospiraceae bacterium]|jgi:alanine dehydrogenase|nr:alanine dehydrogenase [Oscillospiraceae bacterium]
MKIGCVKEIKVHEYRVGLTPGNVRMYTAKGHAVTIQSGAGFEAGFEDADYIAAGASIENDAKKIWDNADMIIKVKEPVDKELGYFHEGLILYTYLHLASDKHLAQKLLDEKVSAVAYETITSKTGILPCLKPMSEIAGRLSLQEGAKYLERPFGGRGVLLGGVPGVERGKVVVLGGGVVGTNACKIALGLGADVTVLDLSIDRLTYLDDLFGGSVQTLYSSPENIELSVAKADIVIGAVLIPGASAPRLITKNMLSLMKKRSVIVDVAIDQGGCIETSHPTTHEDPTFIVDEIVHYCVANMPGAVPKTSTMALTNTTISYGLQLANKGIAAMADDPGFLLGLNTCKGLCVNKNVADSLGFDYIPAGNVLG